MLFRSHLEYSFKASPARKVAGLFNGQEPMDDYANAYRAYLIGVYRMALKASENVAVQQIINNGYWGA